MTFDLSRDQGSMPQVHWRKGDIVAGRYQVVELIGSGGMGEVYDVQRIDLPLRGAMKVLRKTMKDDESIRVRFLHEARALARLESNHVARIVDFGHLEQDFPFLVMERLRGEDLAALLRRVGRLPFPRAARVILDAAWGLSAVHDADLVHRDIKPANLFVSTTESGADICKLIDLGVSASIATETMTDGLVGTLRYMAPEQLNAGAVDHRADLYALSVVLFECIAGRTPYLGDRLERVLFAIMSHPPPRLSELVPDVPPELSTLIERCLSRDPSARVQTAREYARALEPFCPASGRYVVDSQTAEPPTLPSSPRHVARCRRWWSWAPLSGISALSLLALFAGCAAISLLSVQDRAIRKQSVTPAREVSTAWVQRLSTSLSATPNPGSQVEATSALIPRASKPAECPIPTRAQLEKRSTHTIRLGADLTPIRIDTLNPYDH